jgi:HK97 family phage major capsid protein
MSRIDELRAEQAEIEKSSKAMLAKAKADKVDLTDEQAAEATKAAARLAEIKTEIRAEQEKATARTNAAKALEGALADLDRPAKPRFARAGDGPAPEAPEGTVVASEAWKKDKNLGYRSAREFLHDVMCISRGRVSRVINPAAMELQRSKAQRLMAAAGSDEAGEYADGTGGFLLPIGFQPTLLQVDPELDPIAGAVQDVPMTSPIVRIPARTDKNHTSSVSGGLQVFRRATTQQGQPKKMAMEQIELKAESLFGISYAEEELLADSPISFAAILAAGFRDEFLATHIRECLEGNGALGEFSGVLKLLDAGGTGPTVSIAKETGQAASTIFFENVVKMRAACWRYARAFWLANHDTTPQLMTMNQNVGIAGLPAWQPSAREDRPDMLLGRPIYFTEFAKSVGTQGDLILGVWDQFLEGTLEDMQSGESIHVRFENHERTFKFWKRNAGAPWWRTALTPKNSTQKLSPFVVLDAR